jgi:hypothetical protein
MIWKDADVTAQCGAAVLDDARAFLASGVSVDHCAPEELEVELVDRPIVPQQVTHTARPALSRSAALSTESAMSVAVHVLPMVKSWLAAGRQRPLPASLVESAPAGASELVAMVLTLSSIVASEHAAESCFSVAGHLLSNRRTLTGMDLVTALVIAQSVLRHRTQDDVRAMHDLRSTPLDEATISDSRIAGVVLSVPKRRSRKSRAAASAGGGRCDDSDDSDDSDDERRRRRRRHGGPLGASLQPSPSPRQRWGAQQRVRK